MFKHSKFLNELAFKTIWSINSTVYCKKLKWQTSNKNFPSSLKLKVYFHFIWNLVKNLKIILSQFVWRNRQKGRREPIEEEVEAEPIAAPPLVVGDLAELDRDRIRHAGRRSVLRGSDQAEEGVGPESQQVSERTSR